MFNQGSVQRVIHKLQQRKEIEQETDQHNQQDMDFAGNVGVWEGEYL